MADVWKKMCGMAVYTAKKEGASAHELKPKPLSPEARAIVVKLPTPKRTQAEENAALDLSSDLDEGGQNAGDG